MRSILATILLNMLCCGALSAETELEQLGRQLFFDPNLSANRTQSCATCHDPNNAFTDPRINSSGNTLSLGDDGKTLGLRNAPTLTYAAYIPDFHRNQLGEYVGGLFYDGRAFNIETQVIMPILDQREMAMHDARMIGQRLQENPGYQQNFRKIFGPSAFTSEQNILDAVSKAITAFERTPYFSTFDSKYDRYLAGEYTLTPLESLGHEMFYSQLQNCNVCHQLHISSNQAKETFSNYKYHNIGVPTNAEHIDLNGPAHYPDPGLLRNPVINDPIHGGKFRVPSLRNVAVTSPYMHNGVFKDLPTIIQFYNKYLISNSATQINPETGQPWEPAGSPDTIDFDLLQQGQPIQGRLMEALLAFLETLTDARFEALL